MKVIAQTRHFRIEQRLNERNMKTYYSVFVLDADGNEIGFTRTFTKDEAYNFCFDQLANIHIGNSGAHRD